MVQVSDDIVKRLILSKYLLVRARDQFGRDELYSAGLAASSIQDAIEILLRAAGEHLHASIKEHEAFDQLIAKVEGASGGKAVRYRSTLSRLNKARVNFKHFALEPRMEEAQSFCRDMEQFFGDFVREFLAIDPDSISLVRLIGHLRTENWMNRAQAALDIGSYGDATEAAAIAFGVYRLYVFRDLDLRSLGYQSRDRDLLSLEHEVEKHLKKIYDILDLQMAGISLTDYRRFLRLSPLVMFTEGLRAMPLWQVDRPSEDEARFCFRFVLDSILQMKRNEIPPLHDRAPSPDGTVSIRQDCDVLVWPETDAEIIFRATIGQTFPGAKIHFRRQGYVPLIFQRDLAWIVTDGAGVDSPAET